MSISQTTTITLHIKFKSIPPERIAFGPQVNCRAHYYKGATPIILDPTVDLPGAIKVSIVEIPNKDIARNDMIIVYLNYKGIIKTFTINNPKGDNSFYMEVD